MKYLLDTNILVHILRNRRDVIRNLEKVGVRNCAISEISLIELYYGAECSSDVEDGISKIDELLKWFKPLTLSSTIREACRQKAMLRQKGMLIEDYDLLIGCTAITHDMVLVTENVAHMNRLNGVKIENWVER